jgi:hypothetical protein
MDVIPDYHPDGRTQIEDVWEKGAEENIWT